MASSNAKSQSSLLLLPTWNMLDNQKYHETISCSIRQALTSPESNMAQAKHTFVVEHLDPDLGPWSKLEYKSIADESRQAGCKFILSSVPTSLLKSGELGDVGAEVKTESVEILFADRKSRVCLLDPQAGQELGPADAETFDVFLFGGILGDDPPRDRTSELRKKGFAGRRLGPKQMTTDTAVRVTRIVVLDQIHLNKIPYIDFPELQLGHHESTEMPFRYVVTKDGRPVMPEGMIDLIKADADKAFDSLEFADEVDELEGIRLE
jgi:ribosome biogenesis SPOUT family RNA methylase Rps3